jgi:DNA modification methylase
VPFSYHPPTGRACEVCGQLSIHDTTPPIIASQNGKASSANNFPFHNWYNFVLGYTPEFPEYMLKREGITTDDFVVDPFMGTGTTLVVCKSNSIQSSGVDANDLIVDTARTKLDWDIDIQALKRGRDELLHDIESLFENYRWSEGGYEQLALFTPVTVVQQNYQTLLKRRPELLLEKYLSDRPYAKAVLIADAIEQRFGKTRLRSFYDLALTACIVPISNIRYGPGFGVVKPREDVDVFSIYADKLQRMILDLEAVNDTQKNTPATVHLGDARSLSRYLELNSVSLMITSPPYAGDHEYTKHTKLELLFRGYASDQAEIRTIKKRMIRGSTTNLYREDNDREQVADMESIRLVTGLIQQRLDEDGATSGFEKLYTKLVWEYFGGMSKALDECLKVLRPGGKIALLVSDSHAFKMVHIETASILAEIGQRLGYIQPQILLWQHKSSTSHQYSLRENILILQKPN